jgi:hypothetical protein
VRGAEESESERMREGSEKKGHELNQRRRQKKNEGCPASPNCMKIINKN